MKKSISLILCVFCYLNIYGAFTLSIKDGKTSNCTSLSTPERLIEQVQDGIEVTYLFDKIDVYEDPVFDNCLMMRLDGFGTNDVAGEPAILFRNDFFNIPIYVETTTVSLMESEYVDYDIKLSPSRKPLIDSGVEIHDMHTIDTISNYMGFYPIDLVKDKGVKVYRGNKIQELQVSPMQYDKNNQKLRLYAKLKYKITYYETVSKVNLKTPLSPSFISASDNILDNICLNDFENINEDAELIYDTKDYLILTTDKYIDAAKEFAEWKNLLGKRTHIVSRNDWTPDTVKSIVRNYYEKTPSLYYLLIIGDYEDVPSQYLSNINPHISDYYFGCVNESSSMILPDIYCGRLSVSTLSEALYVVSKIINYEKNPTSDEGFYENGINCSYFQDENLDGYADRRFAQTSEDIRNYLMSLGKDISRIYKTSSNVYPAYWNKNSFSYGEKIPNDLIKPNCPWDGNASNISSKINEGAFYVLYRGHGGSYSWADPYYSSGNVNGLKNSNKFPVVFSISCLTGKFSNSVCFAESFLRNKNGGCVAIIASSEVSYSGYNDALACGIFDAIWPNPGLSITMPSHSFGAEPSRKPIYEISQILSQGLFRVAQSYRNDSYTKYEREVFHCFGDPSMQIFTEKPIPFENVRVYRGSQVEVYGLDETSRITFCDQSNGNVVSYLGKEASYICENPEYVSVCICAHNRIPFIDNGKSPDIIYLQNEIIESSRNYSTNSLLIGTSVTQTKAPGDVEIRSGQTKIKASEVIVEPNVKISKNATFVIELK